MILDVDRIQLGYMLVRDQNRNDTFLYIPVWDFFVTSWYESEDGTRELGHSYIDTSLLTINAITGDIVDRYAGY